MNKPDDKFAVVNRIVSKSPVIVFVWQNRDGWPVEFVSNNVEQFMGYTPEEFSTGKVIFADIIHPNDLERVSEEVARYSNDKSRVEFAHKPYRIITKNGQIKWFDDRTNIQRDELGCVNHYEGVLIDITDAKQSEELFKENEKKLNALSYNIPGMIYRGNKDWSVDVISNSESMCGFTREEFLRHEINWIDLIHPDDRGIAMNRNQYFLEKPASIVQEYRIITRQNQLKFVADHKTSRFSADGKFEGVDGIVFDVSAQKRFEQELIAAKEMAELNHDELKERVKELRGIFKLGVIFEKYDDLDVIYNEFVSEVVPNSMQFCDKVYASIRINDKVYAYPKEFVLKPEKDYLSATIYAYKQKVGEIIVAYTDDLPFIEIYEQNLIELYAQRISSITEKKLAQKELKSQNAKLARLNDALLKSIRRVVESEKKFKNIFDFTRDSIAIVDVDLKVRMANRSFCAMFGYSIGGVVGLSIRELFKKYTDVDGNFPRIFEGSISLTDDIQMRRSDGGSFFAELTATPLNLNGESLMLCSIRDITERKQMQQSIIRTIIETEENERKRVAQELHDGIGPILSTIKLFTETYLNSKDEAYKTEIARQLLVSIEESLEQVSVISNKLSPQVLMDFGLKVTVKKFIEKISKISLLKFDFQYELTGRLTGEVEITIYRVITELINNTVKHANATVVNILLRQDSESILLEYSDNGVGFDFGKTLESISGMGLFNIQHRIKSFNGDIEFCDETQNGVRVRMKLPYQF